MINKKLSVAGKADIILYIWILSVLIIGLINLTIKDLGIYILINIIPIIFCTLFIQSKGLEKAFSYNTTWGIFDFFLFMISCNLSGKIPFALFEALSRNNFIIILSNIVIAILYLVILKIKTTNKSIK